jgi:hypothetical protein
LATGRVRGAIGKGGLLGIYRHVHHTLSRPCYPAGMSVWLGIFIGSTIGGLIPELWDASMFSYTSVLFSGIGALAGLWIGLKLGN